MAGVVGSNTLGYAGLFQGGLNVSVSSGDGLDLYSTSSGNVNGIYSEVASPQGSAVQGVNTDTTGTGTSFGVAGYSSSPSGAGVEGSNSAVKGVGVQGMVASTSAVAIQDQYGRGRPRRKLSGDRPGHKQRRHRT
jgi:hypothetical protein